MTDNVGHSPSQFMLSPFQILRRTGNNLSTTQAALDSMFSLTVGYCLLWRRAISIMQGSFSSKTKANGKLGNIYRAYKSWSIEKLNMRKLAKGCYWRLMETRSVRKQTMLAPLSFPCFFIPAGMSIASVV